MSRFRALRRARDGRARRDARSPSPPRWAWPAGRAGPPQRRVCGMATVGSLTVTREGISIAARARRGLRVPARRHGRQAYAGDPPDSRAPGAREPDPRQPAGARGRAASRSRGDRRRGAEARLQAATRSSRSPGQLQRRCVFEAVKTHDPTGAIASALETHARPRSPRATRPIRCARATLKPRRKASSGRQCRKRGAHDARSVRLTPRARDWRSVGRLSGAARGAGARVVPRAPVLSIAA